MVKNVKEKIRKRLKTDEYKMWMDSTNVQAKRLGEENVEDGTVVVALRQTAGKGRRGKDWMSPEGNCYFSLLLKPDIRIEHASRLTLVAALALAKAIQNVSGLQPQIKWPNDIIIGRKKVCGILTESKIGCNGLEYVIIGMGINANQTQFDTEIQDIATSIQLETGQEIDCAKVIGESLNCFEELYQIFLKTEDLSVLMKEYNNLLINQNREVRIIDKKEYTGVALGINEVGELLVEKADGEIERIVSGEVSVRGLYGYV